MVLLRGFAVGPQDPTRGRELGCTKGTSDELEHLATLAPNSRDYRAAHPNRVQLLFREAAHAADTSTAAREERLDGADANDIILIVLD